MNQTSELISTLKKCLKAKGVSYRHVATELNLSETSVKRLFSQESFSIKRIEKICKLLDMDLFDLALMAKREREPGKAPLTLAQEQALADDLELGVFLYLMLVGWPLSLITERYSIPHEVMTKFLLRLDRLGLIELHPGNRVRLLVTKQVFWRKHGPLWERYEKVVREDFFNFDFDSPNSRLDFNPAQLSASSIKIVNKKIEALVRQYDELADMDSSLPIQNRYSVALHVGFRPWGFTIAKALKRESKAILP